MPVSSYSSLPSKFDFKQYYLSQAGGSGPSFPIFRARQRGGFLAPLLKRHGIPFLKWIGRQAASLATNAGNTYLEKGSLSKEDMKKMLKQTGKKAARSALDNLKQQIGSGPMMNQRRDGRLGALIPTVTKRREGTISSLHGVRPPLLSEQTHALGSPPDIDADRRIVRNSKGKKRKAKAKTLKKGKPVKKKKIASKKVKSRGEKAAKGKKKKPRKGGKSLFSSRRKSQNKPAADDHNIFTT